MARANNGPSRKGNAADVAMPVLKDVVGSTRILDARPDSPDFRDKLYEATLVEVPLRIPLEEYQQWGVPILDQGQEGACTGFGLATTAHYLLRRRKSSPDRTPVSPRMFYEMARRYDEWPGEDYSGSSARGAMKGWHKHGVCEEGLWPYNVSNPMGGLNQQRAGDASLRPLGAYYRVNHLDLICMHSALAEVGILYATAKVHEGWRSPDSAGMIRRSDTIIGGHAFAIVAFDRGGFWIQNSWGEDWGKGGLGHISYDDWLANGTDVWVARLGAPVAFGTAQATARGSQTIAGLSSGYTFSALRPHIVSLRNNGQLEAGGTYGKTADEIGAMFSEDFPRITDSWAKKRILLYAHGGLVDETSAVQHVADYRPAMLDAEVYPIAFVWHTDFWSTLQNIIAEAVGQRRPEGLLDATKNFMLDRLDDALEPVARSIGGKAQWDEMKENALAATESQGGGARLVAGCLKQLVQADKSVEIHLVGHSAGSIFLAPLAKLLIEKGLAIKTCTLWAPACTIELFEEFYVPVIQKGDIEDFALFTLTDQIEQDDNCAGMYHRSLLYLVSNAFEEKPRIPLFRGGIPLLGMERFIRESRKLMALQKAGKMEWVLSPNSKAIGTPTAARATSHGGFDDDPYTLKATLARIAGRSATQAGLVIRPSDNAMAGRRQAIDRYSRAAGKARSGMIVAPD